jgi:hypothetical protein
MPNEFLRDRIQRKLASLPDERLYQVLDFVEFLETKYAPEQPTTSTTGMFTRFAEGLEDKLRAGKVSTQTIAETMNLMHRAVGVLNGVAAAGRSVASDIVDGVKSATAPGGASGGVPPGGGAPPANPGAPSPTSPTSPPGTPSSGDRPA